MRLLIAFIAWIGAIAASAAISTAVASSIHGSSTTPAAAIHAGPTTPSNVPTPAPPAVNAAGVKPTDTDSLFIGSNFARILAIAKQHLGARADIETTRLTPGDLELTTVDTNDHHQSAVVIDANGRYTATRTGALVGSAQVYYLSQLGASTPATLARRIAAGAHVPISHLEYMLIATDPARQEFFWRVYASKVGVYFQAASAHGPILELGGKRTLEIR